MPSEHELQPARLPVLNALKAFSVEKFSQYRHKNGVLPVALPFLYQWYESQVGMLRDNAEDSHEEFA